MFNSKSVYKYLLCGILIIAGFLRFYNLNWDQGHYLHPDERLYINASSISLPANLSDLLSPNSPLNPHMFYYGSLPLYIYKLVNIFIFPSLSFNITGRFISALLSTLTIYLVFLLGKIIFGKKTAILGAVVFAFSAGSIEHAHFDTTESMLVFFITLITLLTTVFTVKKKYLLLPIIGALVGLSYATKITGLTFILIPLLVIIYEFFITRHKWKLLSFTFLFFLTITITGIIAAPYQIIDYSHFKNEQDYMQGVIYGNSKPPFVIIYEGTLSYIYPLTKILPFTFGFLSLPLSILGLYLLTREKGWEDKKRFLFLLLTLYPLIYFLWAGSWYTKFSRYYILLFPFLSLWAGYALHKFSKKIILISLIFFIAINGILYTKIYLFPNTRIQASEYIYKTIPAGSSIAGEHWDDNLPLPIENLETMANYKFIQLTVYDPDSLQKVNQLSENLSNSDYFIISSRRVYQSILNNKKLYPYTSNFYKKLFAGKLGFILQKKFTNYPYFFSDDFADETFQSYDHPPVLIFKNTNKLTAKELEALILNK
jgi:4-amino-4-deoxy-L-arabinose transferase-like glycosyltransferase